MEPAHYSLSVLRSPSQAEWRRLKAELDRHGPPIVMRRQDGTVEFTAETWEPILRARVSEAVETLWGHGEAGRTFGPWRRAGHPLDTRLDTNATRPGNAR